MRKYFISLSGKFEHQHDQRQNDVHDADPLVIDGGKPAPEARVLRVVSARDLDGVGGNGGNGGNSGGFGSGGSGGNSGTMRLAGVQNQKPIASTIRPKITLSPSLSMPCSQRKYHGASVWSGVIAMSAPLMAGAVAVMMIGFLLIVATGLVIRSYLSRLNLLLVARVSVVIITVIAIISILLAMLGPALRRHVSRTCRAGPRDGGSAPGSCPAYGPPGSSQCPVLPDLRRR